MAKELINIIHKGNYLRPKKKFPHVFCAGCGHGIILGSIIRAIDALNLNLDDVVMVSGIGCSSRSPVYVDVNSLHTTHGRALPFATGIKLAKPHLKVIICSGDGDASAIGGNHFIHSCRRNIDLTLVVFNNYNYGMTGSQHSPTTPLGGKATTSPYGNIDPPFDICKLAEGAGATYIARGSVVNAILLEKYIRGGIAHNGFSLIEAMSPCVTGYGRKNPNGKLGGRSGIAAMELLKKYVVSKNKAQTMSSSEIADKIVTGVFVENKDAREYTGLWADLVKKEMEVS
ncbi:MAG: 2-oxoacid:ferredoxin oxidoreductase subunit beta [bacterium]